ncbi:hypothetical protein DERP_012142 [Dermatophagoides pteronyssinus]|uniref:Uncharacterized protein n=1 Tax=Dermatophagoides pteronyssinus TaxID=6956 RepID=A0ABQ8J285_DERPT|nr:hypothetical protein DERP_012142 [Dermatophagoides pteronyssinus]
MPESDHPISILQTQTRRVTKRRHQRLHTRNYQHPFNLYDRDFNPKRLICNSCCLIGIFILVFILFLFIYFALKNAVY